MPSGETPKYRLHSPSGLAVVTFNGHDFYLGPWKSKASRAEYDRLIAEWLVNGRRLPQAAGGRPGTTIIELVDSYITFNAGLAIGWVATAGGIHRPDAALAMSTSLVESTWTEYS